LHDLLGRLYDLEGALLDTGAAGMRDTVLELADIVYDGGNELVVVHEANRLGRAAIYVRRIVMVRSPALLDAAAGVVL
jgi:hypothetical protein